VLASGAEVTTLDGLGSLAQPHPLQQSFIDQQAAQCAGCMNGMIMGALGWLQARFSSGNRTVPTDDEVKNFLSGVGQNRPSCTLSLRCPLANHSRHSASRTGAELMDIVTISRRQFLASWARERWP
jgi:nicotinate dehydrogenase subunit A